MNTETHIKSRTNEETTWLFPVDDSDVTDWEEFADLPEDRISELCERYGVTAEFMDELNGILSSFRNAIHEDLRDIWKRLDEME